MRLPAHSALFLSFVVLTACQTSSLTESEKAQVTESNTPFSGEQKEIDPTQSVISFTGKSNIINHEGKFTTYTAAVQLDAETPADLEQASIVAEIDIATVEVDAPGLQKHLLRDDFFAATEHPKATFKSTSIESKGSNLYAITGDLTIKGVTKTVSFDAEITDDYLSAHYDLPREEFGIGNNNYGNKLLDATVPVDVKLIFRQ